MLSYLAFASAALSPATEVQPLVALGDYPTWALNAEKSVVAVTSLSIGIDGRITNCQVIDHVGDDKLANEICGFLRKKRFKPAAGVNGEPMPGGKYVTIKLTVPGTPQGEELTRLRMKKIVTVPVRTPLGVGEIDAVVAIDTDGAVHGCRTISVVANEAVQAATCEALATHRFDPVLSKSGAAVEAVREVSVRFESRP